VSPRFLGGREYAAVQCGEKEHGPAASVADVHRAFMRSPHHRENLLNPDYNVALAQILYPSLDSSRYVIVSEFSVATVTLTEGP
jgi:hypothetical protein